MGVDASHRARNQTAIHFGGSMERLQSALDFLVVKTGFQLGKLNILLHVGLACVEQMLLEIELGKVVIAPRFPHRRFGAGFLLGVLRGRSGERCKGIEITRHAGHRNGAEAIHLGDGKLDKIKVQFLDANRQVTVKLGHAAIGDKVGLLPRGKQ